MIKNPQAYARQSEEEDRAALRGLTAEDRSPSAKPC
jgi:hypothetical protein